MKINTSYAQYNFTSLHKFRPNTIVKAVKPSQETVVVYPDGTIAKGILPKIKEGIDDFIEKVMLLMLTH